MGVPQIWELLRPLLVDKRVPLKKFVVDFKTGHGRPPRIAIDGYSWIFECGFVLSQDTPKKYASHGTMAKAVLNFIHRLKEFLALDVTFMLVFDGNMKPSFKKNFDSHGASLENDYLKTWNAHIRCHEQLGHCLKLSSIGEESDFMQVIKRILDSMRISYVEACGEGEAQCAWLQCQGYVDYVLSNDSDTLVFGCGRMLRNCSKFTSDIGVSGNSPQAKQASSRELFVTVIDLNELQACTADRYNWWSLLFFSVILGADYNHGVKGMGKTKAAKLAQLRDPDFALQFRRLFGDLKNTCRDSDYEHFQEKVIQYCRANSVELFGRNYRAMLGEVSLEGWPSKTAVMYYFHPVLIPAMDLSVFDKANLNINGNVNYQSLDFKKLKEFLVTFKLPAVANFDGWYAETMQEPFVLRHILTNREQLTDYMQVTEEKTLILGGKFTLPCLKVRYRPYISFFITNQSPRKSQSPTKRKRSENEYKYSLWIPQDLIPPNNVLLQRWNRTKNTKSPSPKKQKFSPQKNTLDDFLRKHTSPIKTPLSTHRSEVVLEPVKKKLFVDEAECNDSEDDSLIILGEVQLKDNKPS
ncbi:YEN1 (YER041W) [Zygosaccharomyces parabailii]|uniref:ZYBA0S05-01178g1_1 n=1 Tax=Zygosaccharomyces bailii (strain CLIB 213 / ATCC 58445 / CBS 680 / BCRC 21525 / NBRC 1098 / NCYC 1416 / NRRL Y-2227) TaxID=1333698 RepID=A0A8J2T761_ZYGB2|nr:YEN1 (YER041W) [Zygosaccharomyces parabailii]CDF89764.1 ZYBA0S05-01178g1_1 [Zygosaccharomyces bailii CLIB 213]CDH17523.1 related to Holliday junction resolvase YEN1 [Zygosaccharomyces bailii ISA1307]